MHARVFWQRVKSFEFGSRRIRAKRLCRQRDVMLQRGIAATETCNIAAAATFCFNAASPIRCASNSRHSPWNFDATRCVDSIRCDVDLVDPTRCLDPTRCVDPPRCDAELVDPTRCIDPTRWARARNRCLEPPGRGQTCVIAMAGGKRANPCLPLQKTW